MMEFDSLEGLARHLMRDTVLELTTTKVGLEAAAKLLEDKSKAIIGNYQTEHGAMAEWAPLAEATLARKSADTPLLETGEMRDSITHETEDFEATVGATDPKMEWHEFGTKRIPPRPVLGQALVQNAARIQRIIGDATVAGFVGGDPIHPSLGYTLEGEPDD